MLLVKLSAHQFVLQPVVLDFIVVKNMVLACLLCDLSEQLVLLGDYDVIVIIIVVKVSFVIAASSNADFLRG